MRVSDQESLCLFMSELKMCVSLYLSLSLCRRFLCAERQMRTVIHIFFYLGCFYCVRATNSHEIRDLCQNVVHYKNLPMAIVLDETEWLIRFAAIIKILYSLTGIFGSKYDKYRVFQKSSPPLYGPKWLNPGLN